MSDTFRARFFWVVVFAALATLSHGSYGEAKEVALPSGWLLAIDPPAGWRVEEQSNSLATTLHLFADPESKHPTLQITAFSLPPSREERPTEELKRVVEQQGRDLLATATQPNIEVKPIPLQRGAAYYYHLTDREPERGPGDFKELHQGFGEISRHAIAFTVLTHPGEAKLVENALDSIASITITRKSK